MAKVHVTKRGTIRVRLISPTKFSEFRKINLGKGISGVVGITKTKGRKGGRTQLQSIIIPKKLDGMRARKYLKKFEM